MPISIVLGEIEGMTRKSLISQTADQVCLRRERMDA